MKFTYSYKHPDGTIKYFKTLRECVEYTQKQMNLEFKTKPRNWGKNKAIKERGK